MLTLSKEYLRLSSFMNAISGPGAFRLILATIVVVHHFSRLALGHLAVMLFFTLSGYWIARMWSEKYERSIHPYAIFSLSRAMRLLPVFWLINALTAFAMLFVDPARVDWNMEGWQALHVVLSNILILGYQTLEPKALGPAWSLDIEMQFYLAAPIIIYLAFRNPRWAILVALIVSLAGNYLFGESLLFSFLFYFVIGIVTYRLKWKPSETLSRTSLIAFLLLLGAILATPVLRDTILGGANRKPPFEYVTYVNNVLAIVLMPAALSTVYRRGGTYDNMFGDLSYIVYLMHWLPVVVVQVYFASLSPVQRLPYVGAAILAAYAASWLVWISFDRPLHKVRARIVNGLIGGKVRPVTTAAMVEDRTGIERGQA